MQSPISNDSLKVSIYGKNEKQIVPKRLSYVSIGELHKIMANLPEGGVIKETRDEQNVIIISDSSLRTILPPRQKNMSAHDNFICGCECCRCAKSIQFSLLIWHDRYRKKIRTKVTICTTEGLVKLKVLFLKTLRMP